MFFCSLSFLSVFSYAFHCRPQSLSPFFGCVFLLEKSCFKPPHCVSKILRISSVHMHSPINISTASTFFLFAQISSALVARAAIRSPTFTVSTYAGEATGFPYIGRDGGGGGTLNGKNIIIYSDTTTTNAAGGFVNFSSRSYAFVPNAKDPLTLQDFGSSDKPKVPTEAVPWHGSESCQKNFIWPNSTSSKMIEVIMTRFPY